VHFCFQHYTSFTLRLLLHIILFLHLLCTNHKCTQPCYFPCCTNPLHRRRRWTRILWWAVLGYALLRLLFLWCYGVFCYFVSFRMRVALVSRDIIYVINILYLWHLVICEHFWSVCVEQVILSIHMMSTWFWHKNRVWQKWYQSRVNHRNASLDTRVLSLVWFLVFAKIFYSNF
jgi:hypothetical protein